jgi:glycosyltransferase involved in cell wall biosynthesis
MIDETLTKGKRLIILCFVAYYLPGYRAGGPVRTIANFVDHLGDEFDIRIVTRDRDVLDTAPYSDVKADTWITVGKAQVFYASKHTITLRGIARLLRETPHDLLYLNSFFAFGFTALPQLARRLGMAPNKPCVIAPRGEFSQGAIALKAWKKRPYVWCSHLVGLYRGCLWQASSDYECQDITREFGIKPKAIRIALDLPPALSPSAEVEHQRAPGSLRLIFLSRISPKKNLDFLLQVLGQVREPVELFIHGPLEQENYWNECQALMRKLPRNVVVDYRGEVKPTAVRETFAQYDVFVFPTRGENYGHVILEALSAGTPVVVSDQTPWVMDEAGALSVLSLDDLRGWADAIEAWAVLDDQERVLRRRAALELAAHHLNNADVVNRNRNLFLCALGSPVPSAPCAE